jgi:hypothetical protein
MDVNERYFDAKSIRRIVEMNEKAYLLISAMIFGVITFGHVMRLVFQIPVQLGIWSVPSWPSVLIVVVGSTLCLSAFRLLRAR